MKAKTNDLNHEWLVPQLKLVKLGARFPIDSINGVLLTNTDKELFEVNENKEKVMLFIQKKKKAYLSEISEEFDLDTVETKLILNQLKKENKINVVE
ncbi:MAG: hypothetical protein J7K00_04155 [Candidatus Diapherotrites archaeon]|nr:hypothetical protein [Candidatus Diapherotrites archaeon]